MEIKIDRNMAVCCDSVLGQLSDGIWENSPKMERYWRFANVDVEKGILNVDDCEGEYKNEWRCRCGIQFKCPTWKPNGFHGKSEAEIRAFFSEKIRYIVKDYCKDYDLDMHEEWNKDNPRECGYIDVTIGEAYRASKAIKG